MPPRAPRAPFEDGALRTIRKSSTGSMKKKKKKKWNPQSKEKKSDQKKSFFVPRLWWLALLLCWAADLFSKKKKKMSYDTFRSCVVTDHTTCEGSHVLDCTERTRDGISTWI